MPPLPVVLFLLICLILIPVVVVLFLEEQRSRRAGEPTPETGHEDAHGPIEHRRWWPRPADRIASETAQGGAEDDPATSWPDGDRTQAWATGDAEPDWVDEDGWPGDLPAPGEPASVAPPADPPAVEEPAFDQLSLDQLALAALPVDRPELPLDVATAEPPAADAAVPDEATAEPPAADAAVPDEATAEPPAADAAVPDEATAEPPAADAAVPDEATAEPPAADAAVPDEATAEPPAADAAVPDEATAEPPAADAAVPDEATAEPPAADAAVPDEATAEPPAADAAVPDEATAEPPAADALEPGALAPDEPAPDEPELNEPPAADAPAPDAYAPGPGAWHHEGWDDELAGAGAAAWDVPGSPSWRPRRLDGPGEAPFLDEALLGGGPDDESAADDAVDPRAWRSEDAWEPTGADEEPDLEDWPRETRSVAIRRLVGDAGRRGRGPAARPIGAGWRGSGEPEWQDPADPMARWRDVPAARRPLPGGRGGRGPGGPGGLDVRWRDISIGLALIAVALVIIVVFASGFGSGPSASPSPSLVALATDSPSPSDVLPSDSASPDASPTDSTAPSSSDSPPPSDAPTPTPTATPAVVPGAPTTVTAVPANAQAVVSWKAPTVAGSGPISGYTVTSAPGGLTCTATTTLSCTVSGLANGTPYTFTVKAANAAGTGPASAASGAVTPRTVPGAPTAVVAVAGNGSADVSWTAPSTGGSPITGYTVTSSPGSFTCTTTGATSCPVGGLANGTPYTFTVTAHNVAGTGAASAPSSPATPAPVAPGAPTLATIDNTVAGQITIAWTAPASDGGSPLASYEVWEAINGAAYAQVATVPAASPLTYTALSLTSGTSYAYYVIAVNSVPLSSVASNSLSALAL